MIIHTIGNYIPPPEPLDELAAAIIKQAADDYRAAWAMIAATGSRFEKKRLEREMKSISQFFLGDWFHLLSGCDNGSLILEKLDQEVFGND